MLFFFVCVFFDLPWVSGLFSYDPSSSYQLQATAFPASPAPAAAEMTASHRREKQSPALLEPHSLLPDVTRCCEFVCVELFFFSNCGESYLTRHVAIAPRNLYHNRPSLTAAVLS